MNASQNQQVMPSRYIDQTPQEIPVTGPTASGIISQPRQITSESDMMQGGMIGNTMAAKVNKRNKDYAFNEMKDAYIELVRRGKQSADVAYKGAPEAFKDPEVQQWLPNPDDPGWVDPSSGQFNFIEYSKNFATGIQKYREFKLERTKQGDITARQREKDAAALERANLGADVQKERIKIARANLGLRSQALDLNQLKEINDQLERAQEFLIQRGVMKAKLITPRIDKWTGQPIPYTDEEKATGEKILQAYDQAAQDAENQARWVTPAMNPGVNYRYDPNSRQGGPMVPSDTPPDRSTTPAPLPAVSSPVPTAAAPVPAPAPTAGPKAPVKLNPDNAESEYNALPSGTQFIGPDGITRTKP